MWINNHTRLATGQGRQRRLDLSGKKKPKWQPYQAYSRLYWDTRLKDEIDPEYLPYVACVPLEGVAESLFAFRNRRLRERLANETEVVKAEVDTYRGKPMSRKEEQELDDMLKNGLSEEDYNEHKRKGYVLCLTGRCCTG